MEPLSPALASPVKRADGSYFRFHLPHLHLASVFGNDWFALKTEAFVRFFARPGFLVGQSAVVAVWIGLNAFGWVQFDLCSAILLILALGVQAASAAPLILLALTRQADRDKALADADARHREDLAKAAEERQLLTNQHSTLLLELIRQNTRMTQTTQDLTQHIESLASAVHLRLCQGRFAPDFPVLQAGFHPMAPSQHLR